ncbi:hypothetical protein PMIN01_13416 [Paraphaeosphaeria minitans]|uniref:Uncharacterized protein n=1 Tax=Paraphaeosphaeria minitans TaxID=565426 RepID=A0A9P6KIS1_9PLEO|nr:hypothetical protein PMIN01_13416 [Paraphaeosphaeria minitans]
MPHVTLGPDASMVTRPAACMRHYFRPTWSQDALLLMKRLPWK